MASSIRTQQRQSKSKVSRKSADLKLGSTTSAPLTHRRLATVKENTASVQLVSGTAGDHAAIQQLLSRSRPPISNAEFHAQVDAPNYEPTDRILLKVAGRIVGHVRVQSIEIRCGQKARPAAVLHELVLLPEYNTEHWFSTLQQAGETAACRDGAEILFTETSHADVFCKGGWSLCGRHCYSRAGVRDILSQIDLEQSAVCPATPWSAEARDQAINYTIRLWRHIELASLVDLYESHTSQFQGAWLRSEEYWRWLVGRRGFDRIYVAIQEGATETESIVGYTVVDEARIVEFIVDPSHPRAGQALLARACGDAIERDHHTLRYDAVHTDPIHQAFRAAGGDFNRHESVDGRVRMAKLVDPLAYLESLTDVIHQRALAADMSLPVDLGLKIGNHKLRVAVNRKGCRIDSGKLGRSYLECSMSQLASLLLGHYHAGDAVDLNRFQASTSVAVRTAEQLLPQQPIWQPRWDTRQAVD